VYKRMDIDRDRDRVVDARGNRYTVRSIDRSGGTDSGLGD